MTYKWWLIRISALLFLPSFFFDLEILFLLSSFIFLHLILGFKGVINDYIQDQTLKVLLVILIRLSSFEFLRYILELFI